MKIRTAAPATMPRIVPNGPATGRKAVPGITNEFQPMAYPRDRDMAIRGFRYGRSAMGPQSRFMGVPSGFVVLF